MLVKTKGIVLGFIKYKETSIVVNIYTKELGLKSYIVNGVRDKKSKAAFFQTLTLLDLVVYNNASKGLNRISEYNIYRAYSSCVFNPAKTAVLLFLSEILTKTLKEEHPDEDLFMFISDQLIQFDEALSGYEDFHLLFLLNYATYLGIRPSSTEDIERDFGRSLDKDCSLLLEELLLEKERHTFSLGISNSTRRKVLEILVYYYEIHFPSIGRIQSLAVLQEIFS